MRKILPYFLWYSTCRRRAGREVSAQKSPGALPPPPASLLSATADRCSRDSRAHRAARLGEGLESEARRREGTGEPVARRGTYQRVVLLLEASFPEDLQQTAQQWPLGGTGQGGRVLRLARFHHRAEGHLPRPTGRASRRCHGSGWLPQAAKLLQEGGKGAAVANG